jgi:hypothetical protein
MVFKRKHSRIFFSYGCQFDNEAKFCVQSVLVINQYWVLPSNNWANNDFFYLNFVEVLYSWDNSGHVNQINLFFIF